MNQFDQFQVIGHISPVTVGLNTTPPVSEVIDSQGFSGGRCIIFLQTGNMGRTTTKCFLQESDDNSNYTTFMNVTDLDIDGGQGVALDEDDDNLDVVFDVPLDADRKRYFKVTYTSGSGGAGKNTLACSAVLIGRTNGQAQSTTLNTKRPNSKIFKAKGKS